MKWQKANSVYYVGFRVQPYHSNVKYIINIYMYVIINKNYITLIFYLAFAEALISEPDSRLYDIKTIRFGRNATMSNQHL